MNYIKYFPEEEKHAKRSYKPKDIMSRELGIKKSIYYIPKRGYAKFNPKIFGF